MVSRKGFTPLKSQYFMASFFNVLNTEIINSKGNSAAFPKWSPPVISGWKGHCQQGMESNLDFGDGKGFHGRIPISFVKPKAIWESFSQSITGVFPLRDREPQKAPQQHFSSSGEQPWLQQFCQQFPSISQCREQQSHCKSLQKSEFCPGVALWALWLKSVHNTTSDAGTASRRGMEFLWIWSPGRSWHVGQILFCICCPQPAVLDCHTQRIPELIRLKKSQDHKVQPSTNHAHHRELCPLQLPRTLLQQLEIAPGQAWNAGQSLRAAAGPGWHCHQSPS